MKKISFQTTLLFAPLAYALHHIEEHVVLNFRAWRLLYFPDSNPLSTEAVLCIVMSVTLVYLLLHAVVQTRASALSAVLFLMATQVHNVIFHLGGTAVFLHYSPGAASAALLYVPANLMIVRKAMAEGWITRTELLLLFVAGGVLFWMFEWWGPVVIGLSVMATWVWIAVSARSRKPRKNAWKIAS